MSVQRISFDDVAAESSSNCCFPDVKAAYLQFLLFLFFLFAGVLHGLLLKACERGPTVVTVVTSLLTFCATKHKL